MTTGLRLLTAVVLLIPVELLWSGTSGPSPVRPILIIAAVAMAALFAATWLWFRPRRFEVDGATMRIVWPLRAREISRADVQSAELIAGEEFRRQYGHGMRIGVGGLWGGFGLLQADRETFSMWISRRDAMVIVRLAGGARALLLTPASPERFVTALSTR